MLFLFYPSHNNVDNSEKYFWYFIQSIPTDNDDLCEKINFDHIYPFGSFIGIEAVAFISLLSCNFSCLMYFTSDL